MGLSSIGRKILDNQPGFRWSPTSLLINRKVAEGLKRGDIVWDSRFSGKTETLLAYIALFHDDAIIVTNIVANQTHIKSKWFQRYPKLPEPRYFSLHQLKHSSDGLDGTVFTDECNEAFDLRGRMNTHYLRFGGGVTSQ